MKYLEGFLKTVIGLTIIAMMVSLMLVIREDRERHRRMVQQTNIKMAKMYEQLKKGLNQKQDKSPADSGQEFVIFPLKQETE